VPRIIALLVACLALAGCGENVPLAPRREAVPVLVVRDMSGLESRIEHLRKAGYRTIGLPQFIRFLRGRPVSLPDRPLLLTFDDGRAEVLDDADPVLREAGYEAVLFVDTGRVEARAKGYLTWDGVRALQHSGRWDVQLESGSGKYLMRYGPKPTDVGPFYAFRGTEEIVGGWRERVFGDLGWGEKQLEFRVPGYRPLAIAPPYGNYGQVATNDPEIPRLLFDRLHLAFPLIFTQDRTPFARRGAGTIERVGRLELTDAAVDRLGDGAF
jgi:peptidoglycan/xylan/chitin deacetylase (PgdA/CDA1 family)